MPIHPSLYPLLEAMQVEAGDSRRLIHSSEARRKLKHGLPPVEQLAGTLRRHLLRAGVTREDLHEATEQTKRVTFYDLRATGITWEALAGTEALTLKQRAGHTNIETTLGYIREADAVTLQPGEHPFPPLPGPLGGPPSGPLAQPIANVAENMLESWRPQTGFEPLLNGGGGDESNWNH